MQRPHQFSHLPTRRKINKSIRPAPDIQVLRQVQRYRTLQAELVQQVRLPDGLLEVWTQGQRRPDHYLLEVATYPDLLAILGGKRVMIESPLIKEIVLRTRKNQAGRGSRRALLGSGGHRPAAPA